MGDIKGLRKRFNFVMEYDDDYVTDNKILTMNDNDLPESCVWEYGKASKILPEFMSKANLLPECKDRIHFRTSSGLVHPKRTDTRPYGVGPLVFWSGMKPSPYLQNPTDAFISALKSKTGKSLYGIHSRSHNSYDEPHAKAIKRCTRLAEKILNAGIAYLSSRSTCCKDADSELTHVPLKPAYDSLKLDLMCNITNPYMLAHELGSDKKQLVYASDHENKQVDALINSYGAVAFDFSVVKRPQFKRKDKDEKSKWRKNIELVLSDMLTVSKTDYFHGGPSSTVSHVICFWRLAHAKLMGHEEASNMCSLLLLSTGSYTCDTISCDTLQGRSFRDLTYWG